MTPNERDRLTRVEEQLKDLQINTDGARVDIKSILRRIDSASGGWKALMALLGAAATIGAIITALAHNFMGR